MGFGSQSAKVTAQVPQMQFYPGQRLQLTVQIDNTKSKNDIRAVVFSLVRILTSKSATSSQNTRSELNIWRTSESGVEKNQKVKREYNLAIPLDSSVKAHVKSPLVPTWFGSLFQVDYELRIELEGAKDASLHVPIRILQLPRLRKRIAH